MDPLIDQITELVYQQLQSLAQHGNGVSGTAAAVPAAPPQAASSLLVLGQGERGMALLAAQMRAARARWLVVPSTAYPASRLQPLVDGAAQVVEAPPSWQQLVRQSQAVVVPNMTVTALAGVATLQAVEPASAALIAALIEGRPAVAVTEDINFLTMHAAHLSPVFLSVLRGHVETVRSMGVRLVEMQSLGDTLREGGEGGGATAPAKRGRDVLTREDVEMLLRSGSRTIEVARTTIVTPLAREVAQQAGVEIQTR